MSWNYSMMRSLFKSGQEANESIFCIPSGDETRFVAEIFKKFMSLIKQKNLLIGKPVADPFVIAAAKK